MGLSGTDLNKLNNELSGFTDRRPNFGLKWLYLVASQSRLFEISFYPREIKGGVQELRCGS